MLKLCQNNVLGWGSLEESNWFSISFCINIYIITHIYIYSIYQYIYIYVYCIYMCVYIYTHLTHTHRYTYIYVYIFVYVWNANLYFNLRPWLPHFHWHDIPSLDCLPGRLQILQMMRCAFGSRRHWTSSTTLKHDQWQRQRAWDAWDLELRSLGWLLRWSSMMWRCLWKMDEHSKIKI
jgi:hypothetical protein